MAALLAMVNGMPVLWQPHPGPQSRFLESSAYEVLYGGAAGGGKTDALLFGQLRQIDHPAYRALFLRRTFPELREVIDRTHAVFPQLGAEWSEQNRRWKFPSGAVLEFGYCETYRDVFRYQGQQYAQIAYDELGQVAEERIWTYLMSRNRAAAPGLSVGMRASANPGGPGHYWLKRRFVDACGTLGGSADVNGQSRAYIPAVLSDNPTLMANDPAYAARLSQLPEMEYRWLALGDWSAGGGLAFPELAYRDRYLIPVAPVPMHWQGFAAFDWGYSHPFAYGLFVADEDGGVILVDSCHGRQMQADAIADRWTRTIESAGMKGKVKYTAAGHDCWADIKARSEHVPTLAEQFARSGYALTRASISRVSGLQNMRAYLAPGLNGIPKFRLFDTPGNRKVFEVLESRVSDPDDIEDVLKVDADQSGLGGDDPYDMVRYGLASRPLRSKKSWEVEQYQHGSPQTMRDPSMTYKPGIGYVGLETEPAGHGGYAEHFPVGI